MDAIDTANTNHKCKLRFPCNIIIPCLLRVPLEIYLALFSTLILLDTTMKIIQAPTLRCFWACLMQIFFSRRYLRRFSTFFAANDFIFRARTICLYLSLSGLRGFFSSIFGDFSSFLISFGVVEDFSTTSVSEASLNI